MRTPVAALVRLLAFALLFTLLSPLNLFAQDGSSIRINEIRIDQPGSDNDEYFELAGAPGSSLQDLVYLVIGDGTGGSGVIEEVTPLGAQQVGSDGYFVAAESSFSLGSADLTTDLNFENSDNVTHLLVRNFTGRDGQDLDNNDDGTLDLTPWSAVVDCVALLETTSGGDRVYCDSQAGPDGNFVPGHVFACPSGWQIGSFGPADDTPGAPNPCPDSGDTSFGSCLDDTATAIHLIQGSGLASEHAGEVHVLEGVVVGDFQDPATELGGFFLQEEAGDADADPATSEGIFVFDRNFGVDVNPGDLVRVRGTVKEFFNLTELADVTDLVVCSSGNEVAASSVSMPVAELTDWERYEGMLVNFPQTLTVTGNYNHGRYGEVNLSVGGRLYSPTNEAEPGEEALALAASNARRHIQLEDGSRRQNPDPAPYLPAGSTVRAGYTVEGLTGVIAYDFGSYELHPTAPVNFTEGNARQAEPEAVGGTVRVASMNVLNYFNGDGMGGGFPTSRGARTPEEFARQRTKIIAAITQMDADVIGLMEIENDGFGPESAIQDLVNGLNEATAPGTYAMIDPGLPGIGNDAIAIGLIYRTTSAVPVGSPAILDSSVDSRFNDDKSRPVLAQSFEVAGERFTVAVNHLKSKGSSCASLGDPDRNDGQGNCNGIRTAAAAALVDWLATDPTGSNDPDRLIIGDLNAYAKEDPIDVVRAGADDQPATADDYSDLIDLFVDPAQAYSYVFDGQAGYLDHALASASLTARVTGATVWHINADEPRALDYSGFNPDYLYRPDPFRSSDHDPVIVGFCDAVAPTGTVALSTTTLWPPNNQMERVQATVTSDDPAATVELLSVTANEPAEGDIVVVDDFTFDLRAKRDGNGEGRLYTVTYRLTDGCGNSAVASATVTVAHDQGKRGR